MAYDTEGHRITTHRGQTGYWVDDEEEPYFVPAKATTYTAPGGTPSTAMQIVQQLQSQGLDLNSITADQIMAARNTIGAPSLAQTAIAPSGTSGGMAAPSNLVTVPAVPETGEGEAWQPGQPGYSYDPATVAVGSDGRYYAIDSNGNLQMIASANGMTGGFGTGTKLQEGPKAAATKAMVDQAFANQGGGSFFEDIGELFSGGLSALKEAAPGIALVAGAGLAGGAFPSIYSGIGGGAVAGGEGAASLLGGAGADTLGAAAPGWISAEGGAGYLGGMAADASTLAAAAAPAVAASVPAAVSTPAAQTFGTPSLQVYGGATAGGTAAASGVPSLGTLGAVGAAASGAAALGNMGGGSGPFGPVGSQWLPNDSIQGSINDISGINQFGTGVNDLANIGSSTVGPLAGPQLTGNSWLDSYLTNSGVNLGNSSLPNAPGLGSITPDPSLGVTGAPMGTGSTGGVLGPNGGTNLDPNGVPDLGSTGTGAPGSYQFPWGDALKGLIGAYTSNESAKTMADALKYAADKADPFASQRPAYQQQFSQMTSDPNLFKNTYGDKLTSMVNDPNVLKTRYSDPLNSIVNDPNYFKNEYGNLLSQKVNDPNLFKTPYGDELQRRIADPNLFKNPYSTAAQGMLNDPNAFTNPMSKRVEELSRDPTFLKNQYGTEAGRMIQDPNYFINNPMMLALRDNALNSTQARLSSQVGGDQGSISSRDTLNKSILAAQAPSLQNYFNTLVGGDTQSQSNAVNYFNSLARAGEADIAGQNTRFGTLVSGDTNANQIMNNYLSTLSGANTFANTATGNYLNTLSGANQYTQGTALDYFKSLGGLDTAGQSSINDFMRTLSSSNIGQNTNTSGYLNTIGEAAGAKVNPAEAGNILATGAQSMYNANQQTAGNLGFATSAIGSGAQPSFLESLYRYSQGTSPTNANLGSLFSF